MNPDLNLTDLIDRLWQRGSNFAVYRLPWQDKLHLVAQQSGRPAILTSLSELNEARGFVIAPFRLKPQYPIVVIRPDLRLDGTEAILNSSLLQTLCQEPPAVNATIPDTPADEDTEVRYRTAFRHFHTALTNREFEKLVLARSLSVDLPDGLTPGQIFIRACARYPRSLNYLCHTPDTGLWLGCTPEILLSVTGDTAHTVALAGTMFIVNGVEPHDWDAKNVREQQVVCEYLRERLRALGLTPEEEGPYTARAGEVVHLKSDFRFALKDRSRLGDILQSLHPTPAVCGLPKAASYDFIDRTEQLDRRYYAGFIGEIAPEGDTHLYVNLRCMQLVGRRALLYAGGGILSSSQADAEWDETCHKLRTIGRLLTTDF